MNSFLKKKKINEFILTHKQPRCYISSVSESITPPHQSLSLSTPKPQPQETANGNHRAQILKEERTIEREIIKEIIAGKLNSLRPNLGQFVPIGEHYMCVSYHEESNSDCRIWEWNGHVVFYDNENGYTQEYVYGNYFERMMGDKSDEEDESHEEWNLGLISIFCI